jgi:predicted 2-oxoglutarate/Fe(II)-dependent dioxygenase YbiX
MVEEGPSPVVDSRLRKKMGDAALFLSDLKETAHGVEPVTSGVRYVMPIWITNNFDKRLKFLDN